jgi:hypothetical protein
MKSRILIAAALAALVVPAASFASAPTGQDRENGARACRALRASMGLELFRASYGTAQTNRKNAMGRCVSQWTRNAHQARLAARSACAAEKADPNFAAAHEGKSFDEVYGTGPRHRHAFANCVSSKASDATAEAQQNTLNASQTCRAERSEGVPEFRAKYGKSANDRNAFGKCVSQLAKAPSA